MIPIRYIDAGPMPQRMSIDAAAAPGRSGAQIGQAIEGLGETGQRIVQQVREVEDAGKTAEMFAEFNMNAGQFSNDLLKREDTGNWTGDWQTKVSEYKGQIEESDLSPRAKAAALNRLTGWGSERAVSFEKQALLKGVELGKTRLGTAVSGYVEQGNYSSAREEIGLAPPEIMSSADKERALQNLDRSEFQSKLMREAEDSPSSTLERLDDPDEFVANNPHATIDGVKKAKDAALNVEQEKRQTQNESLDLKQLQGTLTEEEIDNTEYLTPKDKEIRKASIRNNTPPTQEANAKVWAATDSLREARNDPSLSNAEYRNIYNETKSTVLSMMPLSYQGEIRKELTYLSPAGRDPSVPQNEGPISKEDLNADARAMLSRALDNNQFGDIEGANKEDAFRAHEDARIAAKKFIAGIDPSAPDAMDKVRAFVDQQVSGKKNVGSAKALPPPGTGQGLRLPQGPLTPQINNTQRGAIFPQGNAPGKRDGDAMLPADQGYSTDGILGPKEELDELLK